MLFLSAMLGNQLTKNEQSLNIDNMLKHSSFIALRKSLASLSHSNV